MHIPPIRSLGPITLAATAAIFVMTSAHDVSAQSGMLVTSGMGGGASSTARLQAQVTQLQQRLAAVENCGSEGMMFGGSGYAGAKDGQCINSLLMNEGNNHSYIRTRLKIGGDLSGPNRELHVDGDALIAGDLLFAQTGANTIAAGSGFIEFINRHYSHTLRLREYDTGSGSWGGIRVNSTGPRMEFALDDAANYGSGLVLTPTNRVGIGISSPNARLSIAGPDSSGNIMSIATTGSRTWCFRSPSDGNLVLGLYCGSPLGPAIDPDFFLNARQVSIGENSPSAKLHVGGDGRFNSNVTATAFFYDSDRTLKTDIRPLDGQDVLRRIASLNGVSYKWKSFEMPSGNHIGLIAQEVRKVFPELVRTTRIGDEQEHLAVSYGQMVAPLIEAIKELTKLNQTQEKRISDLERTLAKQ